MFVVFSQDQIWVLDFDEYGVCKFIQFLQIQKENEIERNRNGANLIKRHKNGRRTTV